VDKGKSIINARFEMKHNYRDPELAIWTFLMISGKNLKEFLSSE